MTSDGKKSEELLLTIQDNLAVITLNREEAGNALSSTLLRKLTRTLKDLSSDKTVRCAVLRGAGPKAFCAGMDLKEMLGGTPAENYALISRGGRLRDALQAIDDFPLPIIAQMTGFAFGAGLEMALACDIRIGAEGTRVGMPPSRLGIVYPPEGVMRFLREVGPLTTRKLFLTARQFNAGEAKEMGLLDWVVPDEVVEEFTMDVAHDIMKLAPLSLVGLKKSISILSKGGQRATTDPVITKLVKDAIGSSDAREGMAAFAEKRDPDFEGK
ncbi:MAG: enoyl-CoA hydratase/isomerase family protein [Candidatus Geothermincolia bacterium]